MAEPKEVHPLDELFRKSFDDLPAAPSTNGWDTPSAQVWEQVQENIKTPRSSWGQWALAAFGFAVLAIGLWAYLQSRPQPEPAAQPQTVPQVQPVDQPQSDIEPAINADTKATTPAGTKGKKQTTPAVPSQQTEVKPAPGVSSPLPGSKPVFPNNTERNKRQDANDDSSDDQVPDRSLPKSGGNN